ncbi:hypothetical protein [Roseateles oligotrophus]|uniref:Uncharacterized protein n=1 Tax=Roseateles oligotrophus TaxID=1769250 RepID=A0ABT2YCS3_9BURK|nr:hypothetical protein [Roseateles oligotrophus]MCV2367851.1 hypothetical protein [Roseateles oligotrophus]
MTVRIRPAMLIFSLLLASFSGLAAASSGEPNAAETAAAEEASLTTEASAKATSHLHQVQVQGVSTMARDRKTLEQIFKAQSLFQKHHKLAPQASLNYRVYARKYPDDLQRADLGLVGAQGRTPVPLDEQHRFKADPAWAALDQDSEVRSKLADGRVTWRADIRTPGWPDGERRLGDLRLQCKVGFGSGLARTDQGFVRLLFKVFNAFEDQCDKPDWSPSNFADRPIFSVTLVHGERRLRLNQRNLHGLFDEQGEDYDWGFLLRDRMFRLPLGDLSWPDETRVVFEYMDGPDPSASLGLQDSKHRFAELARALTPGVSGEADIRALMGKIKFKVLRFEDGMQIWRCWQLAAEPTAGAGAAGLTELAGLVGPGGIAGLSGAKGIEDAAQAKAALAAVAASAAKAAKVSPMSSERGTELVLLLNADGLLKKFAFTERR